MNLKSLGYLILSLLSAFNLGVYTCLSLFSIKEVKPHQWGLTSLFGIFFLFLFISELKNHKK